DQDAKREHKASDLKRTEAGREVYAGGGIEPDKYFPGPVEGFNPTRFGRSLFARFAFQDFAQQFQAEGDTRISGGHRRTVMRNFEVDDKMVADFKKFLADEEHMHIDDDAFAKDLPFIRAEIHFGIDEALFGTEAARRHLLTKDPQAQFALAQFDEAE